MLIDLQICAQKFTLFEFGKYFIIAAVIAAELSATNTSGENRISLCLVSDNIESKSHSYEAEDSVFTIAIAVKKNEEKIAKSNHDYWIVAIYKSVRSIDGHAFDTI